MSEKQELQGAFASMNKPPVLDGDGSIDKPVQSVEKTEQQKPAPDVEAGQEPPSIEATQAPVAQDKQQPNGNQDDGTIRDPEAWARSQVEKYQRLLDKAESKSQELESRLAKIEEGKQDDFKQMLDDAKADWQQEIDLALETAKKTAVQSLGFSEDESQEALKLLTAKDAQGLTEQIQSLAKLRRQQSASRPAIGNSGETAKPSMAQQIHARNKHTNRDDDVWGRIASQRE